MKYRILGKTGFEVSEIGFGSWAIGGPIEVGGKPLGWGKVKDDESIDAIKKALDLGVNFFDTADIYGLGHSEELLGKIIGKNKDIIIATKVGNVKVSSGEHKKDFSIEHMEKACEESLKRLKREIIDIYQLHGPSIEELKKGECFENLEKLKKKGKIRFYGVSINTPEDGMEILNRGYECHTLQLVYNLIRQWMREEVMPKANEFGIGIIARVPFMYGLLTGKFNEKTTFSKDDHRSFNLPRDVLLEGFKKVEKLRFLEKDSNSMALASLRFILSHKSISTTIPGAKNVAQVEENCSASEAESLSEEELNKIDELYKNNFYL